MVMLGVVGDQGVALPGDRIVVRQGYVHGRSPTDEVPARHQLEIRAPMGPADADEKPHRRVYADLFLDDAHGFAPIRLWHTTRHGGYRLIHRPCGHGPAHACPFLAIGAALESVFIVKMAVVTLLHILFLLKNPHMLRQAVSFSQICRRRVQARSPSIWYTLHPGAAFVYAAPTPT